MDETALTSHYAFGENWARFACNITDASVTSAVENLRRLTGDLTGKTFLDLGCGSGLASLAALRLGASVTAVDLDPVSVETTRRVLVSECNWAARTGSAFDHHGAFDVVYSWGVLHHTGDMWRAIETASQNVKPGGLFIIAIYRKTPLCPIWKIIKRAYSRGRFQTTIRGIYKALFTLGLWATGRTIKSYAAAYASHRGMNWETDIEDWLGGYPYESATPDEIIQTLHGFTLDKSFTKHARLFGLLGSHCDEYVFIKRPRR